MARDRLAGSGDGLNDYVYAVAVSGTDVYAGGRFIEAGGSPANYVAKWDTITKTWSALGSGVGGNVYAIAVSGTNVYVGGASASGRRIPGE